MTAGLLASLQAPTGWLAMLMAPIALAWAIIEDLPDDGDTEAEVEILLLTCCCM